MSRNESLILQKKPFYIGIDPGSVVTGVAVWERASKSIIYLQGFDSHCSSILFIYDKIMTHNNKWPNPDEVFFRIEDARLSTHGAGRTPQEIAQRNARKQNVGYVKALSKDWEEFCKLNSLQYEMVSPRRNNTKMAPELFENITGIKTLKGEHHLRDAANLVIDM